jgi:signal transduction histidine kinase
VCSTPTPALLDRALGNLVYNAVRYGDETITLTAARIEPDGAPGAILMVHDEGTGIASDFLAHADERFRQDESSRAGVGAGVGLSLVDAIVTAHHGQLRICSAGHHHQQATTHPELAHMKCRHPSTGTTLSLLLPSTTGSSERRPPRAGGRRHEKR